MASTGGRTVNDEIYMCLFVCVCARVCLFVCARARALLFVCVEDSSRRMLQDSMPKSRGI